MKPLNLKQKKPSKFKEKLKSFFHVDIEKDLQEEEPTKVFEKIPLINLTRNKIFLGILLFLVIVNILVGFGIDFLYIRAILGFILLVTVPGLLIMLCFKIRTVKFWEFLVYTIGLSIAFIMFAGLIVNWTLPALNITDKPLSLYPILICFDLFLVALGIVGWKRNKDFQPFQLTVPKLDALNNIFFIIPMAFPVLSILGAFLLNNHGSNILTMIMIGGIVVYVLLLTIFRKKLNENIWPWALYWVGLALVLMGSMRGWFISAPDASLEYQISNLVFSQGHWDFWSIPGNYNAMLSVAILPGIFCLLSKISLILVPKLVFPLIFSVLFICLWRISKKLLPTPFAFLATLFFLFQQTIVIWARFPPRQEIAFLFFGLIILILLEIKINNFFRSILLIIFSISLAVSHYSTMIIFLLCLILFYFIQLLFIKFDPKIIFQKISFLFVLFLIIFSFLWYAQITNTSDSFFTFGKNSLSNLGNLFKEEVYSQGSSPIELISLSQSDKYSPFLDLQNYTHSTENSSIESKKLNYEYPSRIVSGSMKKILFSNNFIISIQLVRNLIIFLGRFLLLFGILLYLIFYKRSYTKHPLFFILGLVVFSLFCLLMLLPFASMSYNLDRLYCQMLILLSPMSMLGIVNLFKKKNYSVLICTIFISLLLLNSIWFFFSLAGGNNLSMNLENGGSDYDMLYVSSSEISSGNWLINVNLAKNIIADSYAKYKLYEIPPTINVYHLQTNILPTTINKENYVYSSMSNTIQEITFKYYGRGLLTYNFPTKFLNENKNKIYCNGGSEIFK